MDKFSLWLFIISLSVSIFPLRNESATVLKKPGDFEQCGLACWLGNLTIMIPTQSTIEDTFNLTLSDMICSGIQIGGINSSYDNPTTLDLLVHDIDAYCIADFSFQSTIVSWISGSGSVKVTVNASSLLYGLALEKGGDGLAYAAVTTECSTNINIGDIVFSGGVLDDVLNLLKGFIEDIVTSELDSITCTELKNIVNVNLTQVLQEADMKIRPFLVPSPPLPAPPVPSHGIVNLEKDPLIHMVSYFVHSLFSSTGDLNFNKLVDTFTNGTGSIYLDEDFLDQFMFTFPATINNVTLGTVSFGFLSINATNLDSWGIASLNPADNYTMSFHSSMETLTFNVTFWVNVTIGGNITVFQESLYEEGSLVAELKNNNLNASLQLALFENVFNALQATQFIDGGCILSALYDVNLTQLFFNMTANELSILAVKGDVERDIDTLLDNILSLLTHSFGTAIPAFFNGFVGAALQKQANDYFSKELSSKGTCGPPIVDPPTFNEQSATYSFSIAGLIFVFAAPIILFLRKKFVHQEMQPIEEPLLKSDTDEKMVDPCLLLHSKIPGIIRYTIPLLLLLNIAVFVTSNTSVGATVFMVLSAGDKTFRTPALFNFGLTNSVRDMWNAGVYPLSILIAVFSGIWPYLKLVIMLFCWLVPVSILSSKKREQLLMALDFLGKWSLIDAFVMTMMVVAFHFHMETPSPIPNTNPPEYGIANVFVQPYYGVNSFFVATMLSLVLTHIVLAVHNHSEEPPAEWDRTCEEKHSLWTRAFEDDDSHPVWIRFKQYFVLVCLLLTATSIITGVLLPSFVFEFKGAAGWVLELLGESPKQPYSVLSLGASLRASAMNPNDPAFWFLQIVYFIFTITVPLLHVLILFVLWITPLNYAAQKKLFVATEVLNAWSAIEVFVISLIACILEIRQFAAFIISDKCDAINKILEQYFKQHMDGDPKCFDVIATLDTGCWVLVSASLIYLAVAWFVMRLCHKTLSEYAKKMRDQHAKLSPRIN